MKKIIFGVETSCDESSLALVEATGGFASPKFKVLAHELASQVKVHRPFGGVVPNLAKREHEKNLPILYKRIFGSKEQKLWQKIDAIAVTVGPGLEPALWAGITFAKELGEKYEKPLIGANHLEGHLYSFLLPNKKAGNVNPRIALPAIALIVSGGHTILLHVKSLKEWEKLGETRDDAVGEAFDKVARLLGLPYPGGPALEKLALSLPKGRKPSINFPRPMIGTKSFDFSFSGLKTAVLYYLRDNPKTSKSDVAASFQKAAVDVLIKKATDAATMYKATSIILCGGVAANKFLRKELAERARKLKKKFFVPDFIYNTDNAAMIGEAGYFAMLRKKKYKLRAQGSLNI
ncbi:tRNA (adenosine(37)-N6)-threonylcarbamoyltransferase complex transferase subunit TsaD [Candidatus Parcubacteria bacterium]|nr:MAG: tRNA (adenosine(37)-N6)-threonylcarbamoyltransferase complex transferase subunit TsaD [Candidatus Parcubacteria bacterium]